MGDHLLLGNLLLDDAGVYFILARNPGEEVFQVLDFGRNNDSGIWGDWLCKTDQLLCEPEEWV